MKIRWKFLAFLGVFLMGSFMIVTWKSYSIFSQKYVKSLQMMELQNLEKQAQYLNQQFSAIQKIIGDTERAETHLKTLGISLLAHVVSEDGKWKAQWFEGQEGFRKEAQAITKQVPFESLPTARKSWHLVHLKDKMQGFAYVVPKADTGKISYYVFFFNKEFLSKLFKGQTFVDSMMAYSPQVGAIYSRANFNESLVEKNISQLKNKHNGVIAAGSTALFFHFHPELQLYLLKTQSLSPLLVESPLYLLTVFIIVAFLIGLSLVTQDMMLKSIFLRIDSVTRALRRRAKAPETAKHFDDELQELEYLTRFIEGGPRSDTVENTKPEKMLIAEADPRKDVVSAPVAAAPAPGTAELLNLLRPKAINSLGYLHRLKSQVPASAHLALLEKELRELRNIIDPAPAASPQPYFNPILEGFKKDNSLQEESAKPDAKTSDIKPIIASSIDPAAESTMSVSALASAAAADLSKVFPSMTIRKPKRDGNESSKL